MTIIRQSTATSRKWRFKEKQLMLTQHEGRLFVYGLLDFKVGLVYTACAF